MKKALTIAGSDSGGGAGIQADLATFAAHGIWGSSAIVAVTAQNSKEVTAVHNIPEEVISKQIDAVLSDIGADAIKIGMLSTSSIIETVARSLRKHGCSNIVLDPVMVAESGAKLLEDSAIATIKSELFPLATIITPNIDEAEILADMKIETKEDMVAAAKKILESRAYAVLMKGGHLTGNIVDILVTNDSQKEFPNEKIEKNGHGTGCTLSSAIAANIAKGNSMEESVEKAIAYVHNALKKGFKVGSHNYVLDRFSK